MNSTLTLEKMEAMAADIFNFLSTIKANDGVVLYRNQSETGSTVLDDDAVRNLVKEYFANFSLRSHPHVEFAVQDEEEERIFPNLEEASGMAVRESLETGEPVDVEVVIYTNEGVKWYSPDEEDEYEEDSDGFVFDRIRIAAERVEE